MNKKDLKKMAMMTEEEKALYRLKNSSDDVDPQEFLSAFVRNMKGPKGDPGEKGDDGDTPKKGVDYFTPSEIDQIVNYIQSQIRPASDGKTPVKGVDYLTEEEVSSLVKRVLKQIPKPDNLDLQSIENKIITKVLAMHKPQALADALNTLDKAIDAKVIRDLPTTESILKELKNPKSKYRLSPKDIEGMPINFNDQRWHGGGLSNITGLITAGTNITITGSGTTSSPYVINAIGDGTGDVHGPASAVADDIALFDGITGKIIKDSGVKVSDFLKLDQTTPQHITGGKPILDVGLAFDAGLDEDITVALESGYLRFYNENPGGFQFSLNGYPAQPSDVYISETSGTRYPALFFDKNSLEGIIAFNSTNDRFEIDKNILLSAYATAGFMKTDSSGVVSIDTSTYLTSLTPWTSDVDGAGYFLYNIGGIKDNAGTPLLSIDSNNRRLYETNGATMIADWGAFPGYFQVTGGLIPANGIYDNTSPTPVLSVDPANRKLYKFNGTTVALDWDNDVLVHAITWTGTTNNDPAEAGNWLNGVLPTVNDTVVIPYVATPPGTGTITAKNIFILVDSSFSLTLNMVTLNGHVVLTGINGGSVTIASGTIINGNAEFLTGSTNSGYVYGNVLLDYAFNTGYIYGDVTVTGDYSASTVNTGYIYGNVNSSASYVSSAKLQDVAGGTIAGNVSVTHSSGYLKGTVDGSVEMRSGSILDQASVTGDVRVYENSQVTNSTIYGTTYLFESATAGYNTFNGMVFNMSGYSFTTDTFNYVTQTNKIAFANGIYDTSNAFSWNPNTRVFYASDGSTVVANLNDRYDLILGGGASITTPGSSGYGSVVIGEGAVGDDYNSVVLGAYAATGNSNSMALGVHSVAGSSSYNYAMAIGQYSKADANYATDIGMHNTGWAGNTVANSLTLGGFNGSSDEFWLRLGTGGIYDLAGTPVLSINPNTRILYDTNGTTEIVDWANKELLDYQGTKRVGWNDGEMFDDQAVKSVDFQYRFLTADGTIHAFDYSDPASLKFIASGNGGAEEGYVEISTDAAYVMGITSNNFTEYAYFLDTVNDTPPNGIWAGNFKGDVKVSGAVLLGDYSAIATPVEGMLAYNFTTHLTTFYNGTTWV